MAPLFSSSLVLGSQQRALFIALRAGAGDRGSLMIWLKCQKGQECSKKVMREKGVTRLDRYKGVESGGFFEDQLICSRSTGLRGLVLVAE